VNEITAPEARLDAVVKELLQERGQLLSAFCTLAGMDEKTAIEARRRLLQRFCQLLMDYASLWQFELQPLILESGQRNAAAREALRQLQPRILGADEVALEFNDRYEASDPAQGLARLEQHLSALGERLAERFDAEDRILAQV